VNIRWIPTFTLVCGVALGSIGNIVHGSTDDCLISSQKSTITMYSKEGKLQERIVIRNNKITVYDRNGKVKNRGVVRNGQITMYNKEGAVAGRMVIEND